VSEEWWRSAVCYEVYVRSFADSDGDGVGDLEGLRRRLPYLRDLGVDALWLTPFYPSPQADAGYDVSDPRDVDPLFGDLATFDRMLAEAHALGLRVTVDIVPNHTSDRHPWFQAALAAGRGSAERERYLFRDQPNNWRSVFGGSAWQQVEDGQHYLHLFAPEQPDLNWRHPDVAADHERTLRFWLDRGVDGFRIDVAMGLFKEPGLADLPPYQPSLLGHGPEDAAIWNRPEVHGVYRAWRRVLDSYDGQRMAVGEIWMRDPEEVANYIRPDELDLAFNFRLLRARWDPVEFATAVQTSMTATAAVGKPSTWVLSSHDAVRHRTRYGNGPVGLRRARAAALLLLGLPGPAYLYQGEELGLPQVDVPPEARQDPVWVRSGHRERGRDGCRVPLPWAGDTPPFGFSAPGTRTWLPQPAEWGPLTAGAQAADPASTLALYRRALACRRDLATAPLAEFHVADGVLRWRRGSVTCLLNMSGDDVAVPPGEVLVRSDAYHARLPPDTAVWVRTG
jgi:alpha-glucosidase